MIDTFGLVGYPLGHSFSQVFFTKKFKQEKISAQYLNFEIDNINKLLPILSDSSIKGFNVTIPYKETVIPYLDSISKEAQLIGAVNVVKVSQENGKATLKGYNSDIYGFTESIRPLLESHHKKALILGTGGASKAIKFGLEKLGLQTLNVSRSLKQGAIFYSDINQEILTQYTVIINCTPLGTYPNTEQYPDIPYEYINSSHLLYDLVYNPEVTTFLKKGVKQGATIKNGLEMLQLQAIKAWDIWQE